MKKAVIFVFGAIIGVAVCLLLLYVAGSVLGHFGIQLYKSESDQQRNFNIFLVTIAVSAIISGYYFVKRVA